MDRLMGFVGIFLVTSFLAPSLQADTDISCTAKVALNRTYSVDLLRTTTPALLKVSTDNGFKFAGATSYVYSPRLRTEFYYLPIGQTAGLEIRMDTQDIALCLKQNECYLCR